MSSLIQTVEIAIGTVLLSSASLKALSHSGVLHFLEQLDIGGPTAKQGVGVLVGVEGALGVALIGQYHVRLAATATAVLAAGFATVLTLASLRGVRSGCGCIGPLDVASVRWIELLRASIIFVLAAICTAADYESGQPAESALDPTVLGLGILVGLAVVVVSALSAQSMLIIRAAPGSRAAARPAPVASNGEREGAR
jgi:hypothetical protein